MPWNLRQALRSDEVTSTDGVTHVGGGVLAHGDPRGRVRLPPGRQVVPDQPVCIGRMHHAVSGERAVIVRHDGTERALRPGDGIAGWHLLAIQPDMLRFRAPRGDEVSLPTSVH